MVDFSNVDTFKEDQRLEFKEASFALPDDLWETHSAFANTEGGTIVLGVKQDRSTGVFSLQGVSDAQKIIADFWATLRQPDKVSRDVMLRDGVQEVEHDGMHFIIMQVPRANRNDKPVKVYCKKTKKLEAFIRRGEGDYQAQENDLRLMYYDAVPEADRKPLETFTIEALNQSTIRRYRNIFTALKPQHPWSNESDSDFLFHIGALAKNREGEFVPTQAGLLAFGDEAEITTYFPHYLLDYREETSGDVRWDDRIVSQSGEWSGNVIDFYYSVIERLLRYFKIPFTADETGTQHGVANPITEALGEAIANAIVHGYYGVGGTIRIILKADSLEITNSGTFLVDKEVALAGGCSETRNPGLMRIFGFIGAIDRAGSGLQQIWRTWNSEFYTQPMLEESYVPDRVILTLPLVKEHFTNSVRAAKQAIKNTEDAAVKNISNSSEEAILQLLATENVVTAQLVHEATGLSVRRSQEMLKKFYDDGLVDREKEGRFLYYLHTAKH